MRRLSSVLLTTAAVWLAALAPVALAERADRDKPTLLEGAQCTTEELKQTSVCSGNVVLTRGTLRIMRWVPGEAEPAYFDIPYVGRSGSLEALPNSGDLLLWGWRTASIVSRDGSVIPLPDDRQRTLALDTHLLGFDHRGRAILQKGSDEGAILAADLATGETTRIYP